MVNNSKIGSIASERVFLKSFGEQVLFNEREKERQTAENMAARKDRAISKEQLVSIKPKPRGGSFKKSMATISEITDDERYDPVIRNTTNIGRRLRATPRETEISKPNFSFENMRKEKQADQKERKKSFELKLRKSAGASLKRFKPVEDTTRCLTTQPNRKLRTHNK